MTNNVTESLKFDLRMTENIVGKGENTGKEKMHFLLFSQFFCQKYFFPRIVKTGLYGRGLN